MILLVAAMLAVGILHTAVPDHWAPIAVIARQRRWTTARTARTAAIAGIGHAASTVVIGAAFWVVGLTAANRFGIYANYAASVALVAFGLWMAIGAVREVRSGSAHEHRPVPLSDKVSQRTALLLILGSSPSVEALPVFFAAAPFGVWFVVAVALVFTVSTVATYVALSVAAHKGLSLVSLGPLERYGEVLSGAVVAVLGAAYFFLEYFGRK